MSNILEEHQGYVSDVRRTSLFKTAIEQTLRPGDHVVDLGCGSGVLGLLCLQAGAGRVTAIDSTAALQIARESLTRAGWGQMVDYIHGYSTQVALDSKADVLVCDHVGYFGFDYSLIETMADARHRFLKPGGRMIPNRLRLQLGAVESDKCRQLADGWLTPGIPGEFHWLRQHGINTKYAVKLQSAEILSGPSELGCIDLQSDNPEFFTWTVQLTMLRDGVLHGLAGWFECELSDNVWMTNSPLSDQAINRQQAFLPIDEALVVKAGDTVYAKVMARPDDQLIAWEVSHPSSGKRFSHSTWTGNLLMQEQLFRNRPDHVPRLSRNAQARNVVLGYCDGKLSVAQIQEAILNEHPDLFPSPDESKRFVTAVLAGNTD